MSCRSQHLVWGLGIWLWSSLWAAAVPAASLEGELSLDAAPVIAWSLRLATDPVGMPIRLIASARGEGLDLRFDATPADANGQVRWRMVTGLLDPAGWWPVVRNRAGFNELFADWGVAGRVIMSGEGEFWHGKPTGWIDLLWEDGGVFNDALGIEASDVTARLHCEDLVTFALSAEQHIRVGQLNAHGITAQDIDIMFSRGPDALLKVTQFTARIFGGEVSVEPFNFDPAASQLTARVRFTDVLLSELVTFAPTALSNATGRISGHGTIDWKLAEPTPRGIYLRIEKTTQARINLAANPGFLSSGVPSRFNLLPIPLGVFSRLFSPPNPAYAPLVDIELGRIPLTIDEMDILLSPHQTNGSRSARIHLKTSPVGSKVIKSLSIDININGSLSEVIAIGLDKRVHSTAP